MHRRRRVGSVTGRRRALSGNVTVVSTTSVIRSPARRERSGSRRPGSARAVRRRRVHVERETSHVRDLTISKRAAPATTCSSTLRLASRGAHRRRKPARSPAASSRAAAANVATLHRAPRPPPRGQLASPSAPAWTSTAPAPHERHERDGAVRRHGDRAKTASLSSRRRTCRHGGYEAWSSASDRRSRSRAGICAWSRTTGTATAWPSRSTSACCPTAPTRRLTCVSSSATPRGRRHHRGPAARWRPRDAGLSGGAGSDSTPSCASSAAHRAALPARRGAQRLERVEA